MGRISLKDFYLNEDYGDQPDMDETKFSITDKKSFLDSLKNFSSHGATIYRSKDIKERTAELKRIIDTAEKLTLQETENWFDDVTVKRHLKQLKEAYKVFEKTAKEIMASQQRLEASYEDIGDILGKYYEIG